jgi:ribose 1,5-bisphosphokinase PhnN
MEKTEHQAVGEVRKPNEKYMPNKEVRKALAGVTLVQIIGPTAVGKSTLIDKVIASEPEKFSEVGTITTRRRRDSDSDNVTSDVDFDEMDSRIENRELVQHFKHPSGDIYATDASSYQTEVCLLPTMAKSANEFLELGFERIIRIGIVLDGEQWRKRLLERQPYKNFDKRLDESADSLGEMRIMRSRRIGGNQPKLLVVENNDGHIDKASELIIGAINDDKLATQHRSRFSLYSLEMFAVIKDLQRNGREK